MCLAEKNYNRLSALVFTLLAGKKLKKKKGILIHTYTFVHTYIWAYGYLDICCTHEHKTTVLECFVRSVLFRWFIPVCMCVSTCSPWHAYRGQRTTYKSWVFPSAMWVHWAHVTRLSNRCPYHPSCLFDLTKCSGSGWTWSNNPREERREGRAEEEMGVREGTEWKKEEEGG